MTETRRQRLLLAILCAAAATASTLSAQGARDDRQRLDLGRQALRHGTVGPRTRPSALGPPSSYALKVDGPFGMEGGVFKYGIVFIHSEGGVTYGNTALGLHALENVTPGSPEYFQGDQNTAVGVNALRSTTAGEDNTAVGRGSLYYNGYGNSNTAVGSEALFNNTFASENTAVGGRALYLNTDFGFFNTALGSHALFANGQGSGNTAVGRNALINAAAGSYNIALGHDAGRSLGEGVQPAGTSSYSDNIFIGNEGIFDDEGTIRIGAIGVHSQTHVAGVAAGTGGDFSVDVCVDALTDQLGPCAVSSRRFKEDVRDLGDVSGSLLSLRPVAFRYREEVREGDRTMEYGLIAEEVARVFPELVVYDREGRPATIKYQQLSTLLLGELQRIGRTLAVQRAELAELRAEQARLRDER